MPATKVDRSTGKLKLDIRQEITDRMIAALQAGTVPWQRPWSITHGRRPQSMTTNRAYKGVNSFRLAGAGEDIGSATPYWGTINQVNAQGGKVRKGERSSLAILFRDYEARADAQGKRDPNGEEKGRFVVARAFRLFNAGQCDGLPDRFYPDPPSESDIAALPEVETVLADFAARHPGLEIIHARGIQAAYYSPFQDRVTLPPVRTFRSSRAHAYAALHEAVHAAGAPGREARPNHGHFGDAMYSKEELVAEMGSAILMAALGIADDVTFQNSAAYLEGWIAALGGDPKMLISAASQAEKAAARIYPAMAEDEAKGDEDA